MGGNGIVYVTLQGKKERLWFNNFATEELRRYFTPEGKVISDYDFMKIIAEKWEENKYLFFKNIVYAGIVGDSYVKDDGPRYTKEEVGEMIATAGYEELIEVWNVFLRAQGFELSRDKETEDEKPEETPDDEKKNH